MDVVEKAILMAGINFAEQVETFLEKNGVNPGNIKNFELIQKQNHKNMELILKKKAPFIFRIFGRKNIIIASTLINIDSVVNDFIDKIKEDEKKKNQFMGTAAEDIQAGDIVDFDSKNGIIKKSKTDLEKPLKPKKATDEKNTPKKSLKKKKRKASNVTKWKDSI